MDCYVSFTIDNADALAARSRTNDDVAAVRNFCNLIETGNAIWTSFALKSGGSVVDATGDTGTIEIDASFLSEVPEIAEQYSKCVGYTASVGVGLKLSDSSRALDVAKKRGGNVILLWDSSMASELEEEEKSEEKDILAKGDKTQHDVGKAKGAHAGFAVNHKPGSKAALAASPDAAAVKNTIKEANKESGGPIVAPDTSEGVAGSLHNDFEAMLHQAAGDQEKEDGNKEVAGDVDGENVKQKLVQILAQVKQQLPVLSQLQQTSPDAFMSIMNLVQGVILLGRKLNGPDQEQNRPIDGEEPANVQKSEDLEKAISEIPAGQRTQASTSTLGNAGHDYSHLLPEQHKVAGMKLYVTHDDLGGQKMANAVLYAPHPQKPGKLAPIGHVEGYINHKRDKTPRSIEPHSELDKEFRGKGLGMAMYEGLLSHAKHKLGINRVEGGSHSADANAIHTKLAAKHGVAYKPKLRPAAAMSADKYPYAKYSYTIKEEMSPNLSLNEDELIGPDKGLELMCDCEHHDLTKDELEKGGLGSSGGSEAGRVHENLPVGTVKDGKLKIKHGDGGVSWNHVGGGLISAQDAGGVGGGGANTHGVSSKVPNGK